MVSALHKWGHVNFARLFVPIYISHDYKPILLGALVYDNRTHGTDLLLNEAICGPSSTVIYGLRNVRLMPIITLT